MPFSYIIKDGTTLVTVEDAWVGVTFFDARTPTLVVGYEALRQTLMDRANFVRDHLKALEKTLSANGI